jgi:glycosidase
LGKWYFDQTDFDGVRLDALKHISFDFYKEWLTLFVPIPEKIFLPWENIGLPDICICFRNILK